VASQALGDLGFPPAANFGGHAQVVRLLQSSGENVLESVGGMLADLHSKRLIADYQLKKRDIETLKAGQSAVEMSISIIDDIETFMKDDQRKSDACMSLSLVYRNITGK